MAPNAESYRDSLLFYAKNYERLGRIAGHVQEVMSLSGKSDINAVKEWLSTAAESESKQRVKEIIVGWRDLIRHPSFTIIALVSTESTIWRLVLTCAADLVDSHCQAFVGQFGLTTFFDVHKGAAK